MGDDLGVGFRDELVALLNELALQVELVFDDAVVDDDDAAGAIAMGMGVLFRGPSVRSPACVANAKAALKRMLAQHFLQIAQLARCAPHLKSRAGWTAHGDSRRVVATVLQPPQPFDDDRNYLLLADITDDSAHAMILSDIRAHP